MLCPYSCLVMGNGWITPPSYRPRANSHVSVPIATFQLAWVMRVNFLFQTSKAVLVYGTIPYIRQHMFLILLHCHLNFLQSKQHCLQQVLALQCISNQTHGAESSRARNVSQTVTKLSSIYETRKFTNAFTIVRLLFLCGAKSIQAMLSHFIS